MYFNIRADHVEVHCYNLSQHYNIQIIHALQISHCTKMSFSYFQSIKLHQEGERERSYLQMVLFSPNSSYRYCARKCA